MKTIRIAIVGVGNCASSLLQGLAYYRHRPAPKHGLLYQTIGAYRASDIRVVAAFDIDARKVGKPLEQAAAAAPNCTTRFSTRVPHYGIQVQMGPVLDGVAAHMANYPDPRTFIVAKRAPVNIANVLRKVRADILVNYLPVGSERATAHYAHACLESGVSLVNCIPVFIASNRQWAQRFAERGIPLIGDDIKGQLGATILHRALAKLFTVRGIAVDRTYQLNIGGNTDFLNMLSRDRLRSKKISKTEAVQSALGARLPADDIHIGPSDYVPWLNDRKLCFLRMEGRGFGDCPISLELRLSVEDSPNSAGMVVNIIRCLKLARDRGLSGPIESVSAWSMKHPVRPLDDEDARRGVESFIRGTSNR